MLNTKARRHEGQLDSPRKSANEPEFLPFQNKLQNDSLPKPSWFTGCPSCRSLPAVAGAFVFTLLLCTPLTLADDPAEKPDLAAIASKQAYDQNREQFKDNPDYLVLPGLLANRKNKTVRLYGRATGLGAGDPV